MKWPWVSRRRYEREERYHREELANLRQAVRELYEAQDRARKAERLLGEAEVEIAALRAKLPQTAQEKAALIRETAATLGGEEITLEHLQMARELVDPPAPKPTYQAPYQRVQYDSLMRAMGFS